MTYLTHFLYIHIDSFVTYGGIERFREQAVLYMKGLFILIPTLYAERCWRGLECLGL